MFAHNKRLQYTVRVSEPNPGLANLMLEQFGGPQGELAAACRYCTQAVSEDDPGRKDMLFDIATEELSHLEVIGNIAAEARAKIVYERLINLTEDPGVKEALGFLMTREIAHQKTFEKALYSIEPNFPSGKLPGDPRFTNVYYNMSQGAGEARGSWNQGDQWQFVTDRDQQMAVDGGTGDADVVMSALDAKVLKQMAARTESDPTAEPLTGAELGMGAQSTGDGNTVSGTRH